jgi:TonB family protein
VMTSLQEQYPPLLKDAGIGGTANVWFFIDDSGRVDKLQVNRSSGYPALDQAAFRVGRGMEFEPAELDGEPVSVWVALDITFETGETFEARELEREGAGAPSGQAVDRAVTRAERLRREAVERASDYRRRAPPSASAAEIAEQPVFTPMTVRPQLTNSRLLQELLMTHYPPLLRDAGIGGTVNTWFLIDETGRVVKTAVNEGSGYDELDAAALKIADRMQFTPAYNGDDAVPVWVALDITFETYR